MKLLVGLIFIASICGLSAEEDIAGECRHLFEEKCGNKDLTACMKDNMGNAKLETCTGILLKEADAPKAVQSLQAEKLFDSGKANCFTIVAANCGTMEVSECIEKKGNVFPESCRVLYSEIQEQQVRLDSIGGSCFKSNLDACKSAYDVPFTSYTGFISGLKSVEGCVSVKILANSSCIKDIEADAKSRREAIEVAEAKEADSKVKVE
ncbi:MAG: hypothetical protein K9K67_07230 [Bacteriovoracaceae bacterium]|nr:hypothetical protein [Bacteriovoracaceae bacterium]